MIQRLKDGCKRGTLVALATVLVLDQVLVRQFLPKEEERFRAVPPFLEPLRGDQVDWIERNLHASGDRSPELFQFEADLGWSNAPNWQSPAGDQSTNSRGYRGRREYEPEIPEGMVRVTCTGDSFTWGAEVADAEAYPAILEVLAPTVEAPNLGVSAYGTDQAFLRYKQEQPRLASDYVVVGIMAENIGRNVNRLRPLWAPYSSMVAVKPRFTVNDGALTLVPVPFASAADLRAAIADGSLVARCAPDEHWSKQPLLGHLRFSPSARLVGASYARYQRKVPALWTNPSGDAFQTTRAILHAFLDEARSGRVKRVLVIFFPNRWALRLAREQEQMPWDDLVHELETAGALVLDAAQVLLREQERSRADRVFTKGGHLLPQYNLAIATAVAERLELPSGTSWIESTPPAAGGPAAPEQDKETR